jgi:hypothetical protein
MGNPSFSFSLKATDIFNHRHLDLDYSFGVIFRFRLFGEAAVEISHHLLVNLTAKAIAPGTLF